MNGEMYEKCPVCGFATIYKKMKKEIKAVTGEWTAARIVKFLGLHSSKTEDCSFLADAINAALAAEREKVIMGDASHFNDVVKANNELREQLAAEREQFRVALRDLRGQNKSEDERFESLWSEHLRIQLTAEVEKVNKLQEQLAAEREQSCRNVSALAEAHKQQLAAEREKATS